MWAYANKVTSSRRIETRCWSDVALRVMICAGDVPDHVTIARFHEDFPGAVETLFTEVLMLCARLGMVTLGVVALDGTKLAASASKAANRTEERLRKMAADLVAEHARTDAAEDGLFGDARGDEVPPQAADPRGRDRRIRAALAELEAERGQAQAEQDGKARRFRARQQAGERTGPPPKTAAVELAEEAVARAMAAQQAKIGDWEVRNTESMAATGKPLPNRPRVPAGEHCRVRRAQASWPRRGSGPPRRNAGAAAQAKAKGPGPVRNLTDPDSRLMPVRGGGFNQGYNAQNGISEDGLIIATQLTQDTTGTIWFEPMLRQAEDAAEADHRAPASARWPARRRR